MCYNKTMEAKSNKNLITAIIIGVILILLILVIYFFVFREKEAADNQSTENKDINTQVSQTPQEQVLSTVKSLESLGTQTIDAEKVKEIGAQAESIIKLGDQAIDPLLQQTSNTNLQVRWLTVYCLARLGHETDQVKQTEIREALKKLVDSETNLALKRQAAAPVYGLGDKTVKPILEECASGEGDTILFSEPPESLNNLCARTLQYYNNTNQ